ncbi:ALI_collapsed_G0005780.mRNA.1.CDS.1 [Saccharomyces cerevisiae]|nr:ALI_collapsed_G0005780.mRNA.1.CDS.1 [Saccharomyces cerevisiae]
MAQFTIAVTAQKASQSLLRLMLKEFQARLLELYFEDSLDLLGKLPVIAAKIYRNVFKDGKMVKWTQIPIILKIWST